MLTVAANEMHRGLYATVEVAKNVDKTLPALRQVNMFQTTAGLVAESTDRYSLVRALAKPSLPETTDDVLGDHALLSVEDAKSLLPQLKAQRGGHVSLNATEETVTVTFDDTRKSTFENRHADLDYPNLAALTTTPTEGLSLAGPMGINPKFLALPSKLVNLGARNVPLVITNASADRPAAGVVWALGDWVTGRIMTVRLDSTYGEGTEDKLRHWLTAERV